MVIRVFLGCTFSRQGSSAVAKPAQCGLCYFWISLHKRNRLIQFNQVPTACRAVSPGQPSEPLPHLRLREPEATRYRVGV